MTSIQTRRGPYAKGIAKRAEILDAALAAYTVEASPPLREIAESVGLSEAGVLHYFGSLEELFVAILQARDDAARAAFDLSTIEGHWAALEYATKTPGLAKLYVDMSIAAANPNHPAHAFMIERTEHLVGQLRSVAPSPVEEWQVRVLVAAAEGLQIQWLRDPSVDIVAHMRELFAAISG